MRTWRNGLLRDVDEGHFRNICRNALEGLASKKLNLEMLVERRARARERRVVPETIARFLRDAAPLVPVRLDFIGGLPHTFEPARTPASLRRYETRIRLAATGAGRALSALQHQSRQCPEALARVGDTGPSPVRGDPPPCT